jgi:hypothetical protein
MSTRPPVTMTLARVGGGWVPIGGGLGDQRRPRKGLRGQGVRDADDLSALAERGIAGALVILLAQRYTGRRAIARRNG